MGGTRERDWRWTGEAPEMIVYEKGFNTHIVAGRLSGELQTYCARGLNVIQLGVRVVETVERPMCAVCATLAEQKGEIE